METQPASAQPSPADHFTNFAEISYDECEISEIPAKKPHAPAAHNLGLSD